MKFSKYNIVVEREEGIVLYNSLSQGFVKIKKEPDLSRFKALLKEETLDSNDPMVSALYQRGYVVDEDLDEFEFAKQVIKKDYEDLSAAFFLMLYLTEQCNFRCIYCPQEHIDIKISEETLESVYKHIEKNVESGGYKYVTICLFGGEPLLELKKLVPFLEKVTKLKEKYPDINIIHKIVTNGYLLTSEVYEKMVKNNVKYYQITLDGFAESHNKTRPRVDGEATWNKIVEHLRYINSVEDDAIVDLRANFNSENESSMIEFSNWVKENFNEKKIKLSLCPVTKFSDNVDDNLLGDENSIKAKEIQEHILKTSEEKMHNSELARMTYACKCADKGFYSLMANGRFSKCEQSYGDAYTCGYLNADGDFVYDDDTEFWYNDPEIEDCKNCIIYPLCAARACPMKAPSDYCDAEYREKTYNSIFEKIQKGYVLN